MSGRILWGYFCGLMGAAGFAIAWRGGNIFAGLIAVALFGAMAVAVAKSFS